MRFYSCLALFLLVAPVSQAAENGCRAATAKDILSCVLTHHPDITRAESELAVASFLPAAAGQRPNPELDGQVTSFGKDAQPNLTTEANVLHTFELGSKRKRRLMQADARLSVAQAHLQRTREALAVEAALKLHRLRQIRSEKRAVEESMATFGDIVRSLQSRRRRSAEQDVSLHVFLLAQTDYEFQVSTLQQEEDTLASWLVLATGLPKLTILAALPQEPTQWPDVGAGTSTVNGVMQAAAASASEAKASLAIADSQAWPDLKAGPRIATESGNGENNLGGGAALSLALPLYQRNQGERRVARAEDENASLNVRLTERELAAERARRLANYQSAVQAWRHSPSPEAIEKRHSSFEDEFHRGLIPASLTVEAHRQMVEFTKTRHEVELRAIEALWSLYVLDGRVEGAPL